MTDANTLTPTDAELMQVIKDVAKNSAINRDGSTSLRIARAVLAKWGAPAPASQPVAAPAQAGEYPELPEALHCKQIGGAEHTGRLTLLDLYTADQMRAYVDADRIARAAFKDKI